MKRILGSLASFVLIGGIIAGCGLDNNTTVASKYKCWNQQTHTTAYCVKDNTGHVVFVPHALWVKTSVGDDISGDGDNLTVTHGNSDINVHGQVEDHPVEAPVEDHPVIVDK